MNEENFETGVEISQELQATIEKKVKELKAANPQLRVVFPIVVDGNDYDEKEVYVGYFQQPSFKAFSKYLTAAQSNQAVAMRTLAKDCFLDGDKELVDDDSLFLFGLMGHLSKIIEMRHGKLVNLSKPGK
mgnify:FL=1|jgi:hypothetical protein